MSTQVNIGDRFGRLTVLKELSRRGYYRLVECKCDCGNTREIYLGNLTKRNKGTKSCGCIQLEQTVKRNTTHNLYNSPLYKKWCAIKKRCYYPRAINYKDYGARGISVCDEWKNDFMSFYTWANANEYKEGLTIERINSDGNYEPTNCKFATTLQQNRNKRTNRFIEFNGNRMCASEWASYLGITVDMVLWRLSKWPLEKALTGPKKLRGG